MDMLMGPGKMLLAAFIILLAVAVLYIADKKSFLHTWSASASQRLYGIVFAALALLTLYGGPLTNGTADSIQDAAPLCAGLIFGAPAGLLAGFLSGLLSFGLNSEEFIQPAIGISLCMSGLWAAFLRQVMFDNKKASPFYGLAAGLVMAVLHMLIILLTRLDNLLYVYTMLSNLVIPMVIIMSCTAMTSLYMVAYLSEERMNEKSGQKGIAQTFQRWLLVCIIAAFTITCTYSWMMQTELARRESNDLLSLNLIDLHADILDTSNQTLLNITHQVAKRITPDCYVNEWSSGGFYNSRLTYLMDVYDITEINLINKEGINVASTNPTFPGYNMASGRQSAEFLQLLQDARELVQEYQPISSDQSISRKYAGVSLPNGGFVQVGYDAKHFQNRLAEDLKGFTRNTHIGETGGIIIVDSNGVIVSDNSGYEGKKLSDMNLTIYDNIPVNTSFPAYVHGIYSLCMYDKAEGYTIVTYIPFREVLISRNIVMYITIFTEVILFAVIFLLIYFLVKKIVVENIHKINTSLAQITRGNLNVRINVRTNQEFTSLSDDINATVDTLKEYIAEASARIDKELEFARTIQNSALPSIYPPFPTRKEFDIFACMDAAKEVGGDFYDFYFVKKNRLAFLIADVSGKGIPAAMFMMTAKTLLKSLAESGLTPSEVFCQANEKLCESNEAGMFVTAWLGILDTDTGLVEFVNAGHNPPLWRKQGEFSYLRTKANFVLAGMEGVPYKTQQLQLAAGDMLLLYTDGLTEAMNSEKELFGEERALSILSGQKTTASVHEVIDNLKSSITTFTGEAEQSDDITLLAITFNGSEKPIS